MTDTEHVAIEPLIKELFARGLRPQADAKLRAHLQRCESCARLYERYAEAERALHHQSADTALNPSLLARIEDRLFDNEPQPQPRYLPRIALALTAVGALAVTTLTVMSPPTQTTLQPRGEAATTTGLVFRALRVRQVDGAPQVQELGHGVHDVMPGDEIALLYVNLGMAHSAQVTLHTPDQEPRILVARQDILQGVQDERLGPVIKVSEDWPAGRASLKAHFDGPDGTLVRQLSVQRPQP